MRRFSALGLFLFFCLTSVMWTQTIKSPTADERTGVFLLKECGTILRPLTELTVTEGGLLMHCTGYMLGLKDVLVIWNMMSERNQTSTPHAPVCLPPRATAGDLARVVVKYLNNHQDQLHDGTQALGL